MPCLHNTTLGKLGEDLACAELSRRGYAILDRRYRTRCGELDIVARDGATIVFIEVKTRSSLRFGTPAESITWRKRRRLCLMAAEYLVRKHLGAVPCRFDLVAIVTGGGDPTLEIVRGMFTVS